MTKTLPAPKKRTPKVYSYVRISGVAQRKGRGLKRQDADSLKWCVENKCSLEPANCFSDRGVSAFKKRNNAEHGELKLILKLIEDGKIEPGSILLIESLDRLSRKDINISVQLLLQIINSGVIVVTMIDKAVYRADANPHELMASLMMSIAIFMRANDESRTKSLRKADSWRAKREAAERGEYHGGNVPRWLKVVNGKYRVVQSEAQIVRDIFNDYVHGSHGLYRLHHKYGVASPTIAYWLANPVVLGTLTVKEGNVKRQIEGHYPAIIERQLFELALQKRGENYVHRRVGAIGEVPNLFAGLLIDMKGQRMIVGQHNGGVRNYVSRGCVIRCEYLEKVVCAHKLLNKFVNVTQVEDAEPLDVRALDRIDRELKQLQATMMEEPGSVSTLLPVVRKLTQDRAKLAGAKKVVRESVSLKLIEDLWADKHDKEARLQLADLVRQTISEIKLTKVDGSNWYVMVHGVITLTTGRRIPFRYAYHTRRMGCVICDMATPPGTSHPDLDETFYTEVITDEVKAELARCPLRRERVVSATPAPQRSANGMRVGLVRPQSPRRSQSAR